MVLKRKSKLVMMGKMKNPKKMMKRRSSMTFGLMTLSHRDGLKYRHL